MGAEYLASIEVERMGFAAQPDSVRRLTNGVAAKLVALPVPPKRGR